MAPRLVFYSDQIAGQTEAIDARLLELLSARPGRVGYVPAGPDRERAWFDARVRYYSRLGLSLSFCGVEDEFSSANIGDLLTCNAIHLTGGNTFRFLHWLRARGLVPLLQRYVAEGGVLIGVSAGAILMTRDISSATLCGDSFYPGLTDHTGLSLVDFGVLPHFDRSRAQVDALGRLSIELGNTAYGIPDGAGIVVDGSRVELLGPVVTT